MPDLAPSPLTVSELVMRSRRLEMDAVRHLADRAVLDNGFEKKQYQYNLLNAAMHAQELPLTNSFAQSLLKKRIKMMNRKPSHYLVWSKYVALLALIYVSSAFVAPYREQIVELAPEVIRPLVKPLVGEVIVKESAKKVLIEDLDDHVWERAFDVNVGGVIRLCRAVIPAMKKQRSGRIINAASFAAIVPSVRAGAYAASKAAVVQLTRTLAGELGPWGVTANAYAPGMIPTSMNGFAEMPLQRQDELLDSLTVRRWGVAADIADLVCFLASDASSYITGTLIDISGGKLATQFPQRAYRQAALLEQA